jgi:2-dehydro-3-deoxygluconokinase
MKAVCFGEIMLRLNPDGYRRFLQTDSFVANFGGAEANVAVSLAQFGVDSHYITKLPCHEIGQMAINSIRRYGVDTSEVVRGGDRIGVYYLEKGASQRGSKVIYDRKYSAFSESTVEDYDWEKILNGTDWFHFTGITPALGDNIVKVLTEALKVCRKKGITVSCDLNYRNKLWTIEECAAVMTEIMPFVDVLVANEEHADFIFGIKPENCKPSTREAYISVARQLYEKFSLKASVITIRESITADDNKWGAMIYDGKEACFSEMYKMHMVDRVGGGDAFCGAYIYTQLAGYKTQDAVDFAAAAGVLKHSIEGDYNLVSKEDVERLVKFGGNGRTSR